MPEWRSANLSRLLGWQCWYLIWKSNAIHGHLSMVIIVQWTISSNHVSIPTIMHIPCTPIRYHHHPSEHLYFDIFVFCSCFAVILCKGAQLWLSWVIAEDIIPPHAFKRWEKKGQADGMAAKTANWGDGKQVYNVGYPCQLVASTSLPTVSPCLLFP